MKASEVPGERPLFGGKWKEGSIRSLSGANNALSHWILSGTNELLSSKRWLEVALQLQHASESRALWHHCSESLLYYGQLVSH